MPILNQTTHYKTRTDIPSLAPLPLLLDTYPGAGYAFSFRKLRLGYAGSAVRIRRVSDNVEQDIGFSGSDFDSASAASFIGGSTGRIVKWYDQSGNGKDQGQSTAANQPVYTASGIHSLPMMTFDGSNHFLISTSSFAIATLLGSNSFTVFSVVIDSGSGNEYLLVAWEGGGGTTWELLFWGTNQIFWDGPNRVAVTKPSGWINNPHIVEAYRELGTNLEGLVVDGVSLGTTAGANVSNAAAFQWVAEQNNDTNRLSGTLGELIVWPDQGSSGRTGIRNNLNSYYVVF